MKLEEEPKSDESHYANIMDFKMEYEKAKEEMAKQQKSMSMPRNRIHWSQSQADEAAKSQGNTHKSNTIIEDLNRARTRSHRTGICLRKATEQAKEKELRAHGVPTEVKNIWGHGGRVFMYKRCSARTQSTQTTT